MASRFQNKENENFDIAGSYLFGDRDFDQTSSFSYGQIGEPGRRILQIMAAMNWTLRFTMLR